MIIKAIKRNKTLYRYSRLFLALLRLKDSNFTALEEASSVKVQNVVRRKKVLLTGMVGLNPDMLAQTIIGLALQRSGAEVFQLSCDAVIKHCFNCKSFHYPDQISIQRLVSKGQGNICSLCRMKSIRYAECGMLKNFWLGSEMTNEDWLKYRKIEKLIFDESNLDALRAFIFEDLHVGEHAYSATVRFFASPSIEMESHGISVLRQYLLSAVIVSICFQRFLEENCVDLVVVDHGIYVPQGVIAEITKKKKIRLLTFNTGYRKNTFLFAEGDSYHFAIPRSNEFISRFYSDEQRKISLDYVQSRAYGTSDWVHFQPKQSDRILNIDSEKINIAIFPNVLWDADVHFEESLFASSSEWLVKTLAHLANNNDVVVHLRVHPGELKGAIVSRYGITDLLAKHRIYEGKKLIVYDAYDDVNSYILAKNCYLSVVYGSKIAVDLAALGLRVVTAGDCWTRNKGVTTDPSTIQEYFRLLDTPRSIVQAGERALDYAYYLYFEKMYLFDFVSKRKGDPPFNFDSKKFDIAMNNNQSDINRLMREILN